VPGKPLVGRQPGARTLVRIRENSPTNVSRNGSAHSHGDEGIPVVTSTTISRKQSSGAVLPKYQDRPTLILAYHRYRRQALA
jgi:hypothetical protein